MSLKSARSGHLVGGGGGGGGCRTGALQTGAGVAVCGVTAGCCRFGSLNLIGRMDTRPVGLLGSSIPPAIAHPSAASQPSLRDSSSRKTARVWALFVGEIQQMLVPKFVYR